MRSYFLFKICYPIINMFLFEGLAVGNGFSDPVNMIDYSEYVYQLGLVDANTRDKMKVFEQGTKDYIANEQWLDAWTVSRQDLNVIDSVFHDI